MIARAAIAKGAIATAGVVMGIGSAALARAHPDLSLAGDAPLATVAQLAAGWGLVAAGLAHWTRRPSERSGALLATAGLAWFVAEADNPEIGSSVLFSAGLILSASCPPLIAHAVFEYAGWRTRAARALLALGYIASIGVLGLLSATRYDPAAQGCLECPANLAHVGGSAQAEQAATRTGLWLLAGWGILTVALLTGRLVRSSAASRRLAAPVVVPAAVYLALVVADALHGVGRGFQSNDATDRALWAGQAVALVALALGVTWERVRAARTRAALTRLVVDLDRSAAQGGVRDALARALGEPDLTLVYRATDGGWLDIDGHDVPLPPQVSMIGPAHAPVAAIGHRPGALGDAELVADIGRAARPTLEHERLTAEQLAQLAALRASRARIVAASDAERRRLERDLHDGAQQRIVALALDLRLGRRRITRQAPKLDAHLGAAEDDLRLAVAELRDIARGIHPPMLEDSGLAAALQALAEEQPRIALGDLPGARFPATVEAAAYHLVADTVHAHPEAHLTVSAHVADATLVIEMAADAGLPHATTDAEDRIGAIGGRLIGEDGRVLRVELPCAL